MKALATFTMRCQTYKPVVCFGLAVWLLLHSCAFGLCHRHAQGEDRHFHGLGLVHYTFFPQVPDAVSNNLAHQAWHFHVVFFGLEIHLVPDQTCSLPFWPGISLVGEKHFLLAQLLETYQESCQASNSLSLPLDFLGLALVLDDSGLDSGRHMTNEVSAFSETVCALALRLCSGTQRI